MCSKSLRPSAPLWISSNLFLFAWHCWHWVQENNIIVTPTLHIITYHHITTSNSCQSGLLLLEESVVDMLSCSPPRVLVARCQLRQRRRGRCEGVEGEQSAARAGSETDRPSTVLLVVTVTTGSNNPPTLHTPRSTWRNCFQYLDSNMLLVDKDGIIELSSWLGSPVPHVHG